MVDSTSLRGKGEVEKQRSPSFDCFWGDQKFSPSKKILPKTIELLKERT